MLGWLEGSLLGWLDGIFDGRAEGISLGWTVMLGSIDGGAEGISVGDLVGPAVVVLVGGTVGG